RRRRLPGARRRRSLDRSDRVRRRPPHHRRLALRRAHAARPRARRRVRARALAAGRLLRYDAAVRAALAIVISLGQLALWALLAAASAHLLRLARWGWGRPLASDAPPALADFPVVTVQLPIRNERYVAERVLRAACALDWPRDRLEVQAPDDSDDDTRAIVDRVAAELRAAGHDVKVIRRESRAGFKAGNLAHGLATARGEFIAVLDADSVPPRDLLARLVPPLLG